MEVLNRRANLQVRHKKAGRSRFSLKIFISFLIFEFLFTGITMPALIFYGPFDNVKRTVIGQSMNTLKHRWIAQFFLTPEAIYKIMGDDLTVQDFTPQGGQDGLPQGVKIAHDSSIEYKEIESKTFKGYMLIIHDPSRVNVAYSSQLLKKGETTSVMAKNNNAVAAINGGGFVDPEWTSKGDIPLGVVMHDGNVIYIDKSENARQDIIAITESGNLIVGKYSVKQLKVKNVKEAVSFGPPLVIQGKGTIKKGDGGWGIAPRTAIGQRKEDGAILLLVIDGRQLDSLGATLRDVQEVMLKFGAYTAGNLDGGSSATMYYNGKVINNPCDTMGERKLPTAIVVVQKGG